MFANITLLLLVANITFDFKTHHLWPICKQWLPKQRDKQTVDLGDDEAATPGTHIAPGNAVILTELFEPAIE